MTNRIAVARGRESEFEERFCRRVHPAFQSPGFIRNEVHRPHPMRFDPEREEYVPDPKQPAFYEVKTWWRSFQDFEDWVRSPASAETHELRAPKGLLSAPTQLHVHEVFIEAPPSGNL